MGVGVKVIGNESGRDLEWERESGCEGKNKSVSESGNRDRQIEKFRLNIQSLHMKSDIFQGGKHVVIFSKSIPVLGF